MGNDVRALWERILAGKTGRDYWRSLAELVSEGSPEDRQREFPEGADERPDEPSRRSFMKLLGASMALAGVTGCVKDPVEKILPYTHRPPEVTPGLSRYYATSMTLDGLATGLLVASRDGRPIKIEGNPDHPASLGAAGVLEQASILGLYDPNRARAITQKGALASWDALATELARPRTDRGAGLRILIEPTASPLLASLLGRLLAAYPAARVTVHSAFETGAAAQGATLAFGRPLVPQLDLRNASVVVSLDSDFLDGQGMHLRHSRHFAERRRPGWPSPTMNRLYVVESMPSCTGTVADHKLRRRSSEIGTFAAALAAEILLGGKPPSAVSPDIVVALRPFLGREERALVGAIARDLVRAGNGGLVVVGDRQPAHVHALGALVNSVLGAVGSTVSMTDPILWNPGTAGQDLAALVAEMRVGAVDTLVILGGNPVYTAPGGLDFAGALGSVRQSFYLGLYADETGARTTWFVPETHYLEAWGDGRAGDGTASVVQPLIRPLFGGRTDAEILATLLGTTYPSAHALVREQWRTMLGETDFEARWEATLRRGFLPGSEAPVVRADLAAPGIVAALATLAAAPAPAPDRYELGFYYDSKVHDGRFANNPWLQELPDPTTKITWDNAAVISIRTASELGVMNGDLIEITLPGFDNAVPAVTTSPPPATTVVLPAFVMAGHADRAISLRLGYGRGAALPVAEGVGTNVQPLRRQGRSFLDGASVRPTGEKHALAQTQKHWELHDRPIALSATLEAYRDKPGFTREQKGPVLSILPAVDYTGEQWAMSIDMSICTGCSACVVACQAENNIPVVGKAGVLRSREMHWLRIDTYHTGEVDTPEVVHQPMLCQHCEKAPCEYVCPVNATVHSPDGLNEMVYNRCIGTRFCSNNCPYKVRRFNWFDWMEEKPEFNGDIRTLQKNPDVTVRERGVMEKCTFCVQRIRRAEIDASIERRAIRPGEVTTACAQACPTSAIRFGSLAHKETDMVRWREEPRSFGVLHELGTRPRIQYLALIKNPNPEVG
ncbi:TAT-variant-translocated molybdopterin oxidoreductase [Polyangium sp. y55x31]|uniref:TAT-variant-translocated molybdopterin oxidoreductase n=1 Tax=Polyangium sp. y55x31 TaxID=3042688 RepID=UPI002482A156|nr:TAT-variant-translocated molybdopterin oxidoreductase [Polyangium sp. y55x31]MDI1480956.1 TAT-variant-translocated molybdopterin oxidoreductase [Polyangium sp. y55x31]